MADDVPLLTVPKPGNQELRICLSEYRGHRFLSLRIWFRAAGGEMRPGREGCTVPLWALTDFRQALEEAEAIIDHDAPPQEAPAASRHH